MSIEFASASFSAVGKRQRNEDRVADWGSVASRLHLWAAADGLGGHDAGDVAAQTALGAVVRRIEEADSGEDDLQTIARSALEDAQSAVVAARAAAAGSDMATTLSLVVADDDKLVMGHAGDTRIYRVRDEQVDLLTRDHTVSESLRRLSGSDAPAPAPHANTLLSSIGNSDPFLEVSEVVPILSGDVFLICTDGLWAHLDDRALLDDLRSAADLDGWLGKLQKRVEAEGDPEQDNYSAIAFCRDPALSRMAAQR